MRRYRLSTLKLAGLMAMVIFLADAPALAQTYGQRVVAAVLLSEARSEGQLGMIAVAEVIRTRADRWGISPLGVVKKHKHFSCLNNTTPEQLIRKFRNHPSWPQAVQIARTMYNEPEKLPGVVMGATHYASNEPFWAENHAPIAKVGELKFYRLKLP